MNQRRDISGYARRAGAIALTAVFLSGCSYVPDWANPVEWYRDTRDWIAGDETPKAQDARADASQKQKKQGSTGQYPNLASVPDRPRDISDSGQAGQVQSGLAADRAQARHAALGPSDTRPGAPPPPVIASPPPPPSSRVDAPPPPPAPAPVASAAPAPQPQMAAPPPVMPAMPAAPMISSGASPMASDAGTETARQAFEAALSQSGGVVRGGAPTGGIRDVNHSSVVASSSGRSAPVFPSASRVSPGLRPPAMAAEPVAMAAGAGAPAARILFANNSSKLSGNDNSALENIANMHKSKGGIVRVVGHASSRTRDVDPLRHRLVNFRLSLARAQAVANALTKLGVPVKDIVVEARADNEPLYYEFMPSGEAGNRRAEIYLDY
jgi:outer membrane protein OmpA-like peptidoglycan-associated protein